MSLLNKNNNLFTTQKNAQIITLPFLFINDTKYKGQKLYRTYLGYRYQGGFSDHLPIRLKVSINNND